MIHAVTVVAKVSLMRCSVARAEVGSSTKSCNSSSGFSSGDECLHANEVTHL